MNEQFNKGYEQMVDTVKERAIWRIGDRLEEGATFRCECPGCRFNTLHQRFDLTRHRLLFGRSIKAVEAPRPMIRCRRCGQQRHLRDLEEFVAPSTVALHDGIVAAFQRELITGTEPLTMIPSTIRESLAAFREESSGAVRQRLIASVAALDAPERIQAVLDALGRELYLSKQEVESATESAAD